MGSPPPPPPPTWKNWPVSVVLSVVDKKKATTKRTRIKRNFFVRRFLSATFSEVFCD